MWKFVQSEFMKLAKSDLMKGAFLAAITIIVTGVGNILTTGALPTWEALLTILSTGGIAFLSYLVKNLFSNSAGQPLKTEANVLKNDIKVNASGDVTTTVTVKK